ncbi:hypothetical protein A9179_01610 [Pseudomonas alcaligenes]|uniref:Solute-binding protein family 3/N-terminal domain-containing protein n=1 Tax=Aquipseudomonas alcaligenes TaxID=43263 RepID=A0ABR7RW78_AQUAC|nr:hypothetical protein [Pseudomonas alcaligenes]
MCLALLLSSGLGSAPLQAEETWVVAVADLPGLVRGEGAAPLLAIIQALDRELPDVRLELRIVPFARSLLLVQQGEAELQMPFLEQPLAPPGLHYGREALGEVRFALYTRRQLHLTRAELLDPRWHLTAQRLAGSGLIPEQQARLGELLGRSWRLDQLQARVGPQHGLQALAYPYRIETDRAHVDALGLPALPGNSVANSLEKLLHGRIQGYVFAVNVVDPAIDSLGLRGQLRAVHFNDYPARWLRADNPRGAMVDRRISAALQAIKANGEYQRLGTTFYRQMDWQPWP